MNILKRKYSTFLKDNGIKNKHRDFRIEDFGRHVYITLLKNVEAQNTQLLETIESLKCCENCTGHKDQGFLTNQCFECSRNKNITQFKQHTDNWIKRQENKHNVNSRRD